jgi:hypothetical protein
METLADLVVLVHLGFLAFLVSGGLLAQRWRSLLPAHVLSALYALFVVVVASPCPLTWLEVTLRRRAGAPGYSGGFIDHYLTGVLYPEHLKSEVQLAVAALVLASYLLLGLRWRARSQSVTTARASGEISWPTPGSTRMSSDAFGAASGRSTSGRNPVNR